jgi:hypothetical protein
LDFQDLRRKYLYGDDGLRVLIFLTNLQKGKLKGLECNWALYSLNASRAYLGPATLASPSHWGPSNNT